MTLIARLRTALRRVPHVERVAWTALEIPHHWLPALVESRTPRPGPRHPNPDDGVNAPPTPHPAVSDLLPLAPATGVVNPVLTAADVTDYPAQFVADPFLYRTPAAEWHLFFEVFDADADPTGVIAHANSPDDGTTWEYDRIVLTADCHQSYPYVFRYEGQEYMIPEQDRPASAACLRLYAAHDFPYGWEPVCDLVRPGFRTSDHAVFRFGSRWWALVADYEGTNLHAYHSDDLTAEGWTPHAANPVVSDRPWGARPAGRPVVFEDRILLFTMDVVQEYGHRVRAFEVTDLTPETYTDQEIADSPALEGTGAAFGWDSGKMHHADPWWTGEKWRVAVDGNVNFGRHTLTDIHWAIGIYEAEQAEYLGA